ncbi:disease resistance protein RPS6-like isoform X2 [Brassica napus]|uniref:disease resistance protein RPS6-like isoform X2 n=1 Tax=Brassica napus TaxID=3708 RepID=UPI0006AA7EB7|nr:disease resistance protein RPS6-like isoform X2 [Brassica napus]
MSSSRNWVFDVFPSFRGLDVRKTFLSHFLKELDLRLIIAFKDSKIERSQAIEPELLQAIRSSRIAVVMFSKNYASSKWCLDELLEIVKCKQELEQIVIPVFYGLDPSDIRKQLGEFGEAFDKTCKNRTESKIQLWRQALTDVANLEGHHSRNWDNEAKMIEAIVADILVKLNLTPSRDFDEFVGINDHIAKMSVLLNVESEEVRMVGIWGPSGIGKTAIARALFDRLSHQFEGRIFIDSAFISKNLEDYRRANSDDYNMKLSLQGKFLSEILGYVHIKIDHLGAARDRLMHRKVLIVIDDLDDQVVVEALAGGDDWFGIGSRIIVVTKDKHLLEAHGIGHIYTVGFPSEKQALEMFCRSAFVQNYPPDGFVDLASKITMCAGGLPLALQILGKAVKRRNKEYWTDMLSRLGKSPNRDIVKGLRVSYDALDSEEDKAIFRHIACFFNGMEIDRIKLMFADSGLNVNIGLTNLVDKSLISVKPSWNNTNIVEMHSLVQEIGKEVVRTQSNKPGKREFLMDSKDVCNVLGSSKGSEMVIGISMNLDEISMVRIHENAFDEMTNLRFLKFYKKSLERKKEVRWLLPERFDNFPDKLKLLSWPGCPMVYMPSSFCPEYLVELIMPNANLVKLWDGVEPLTCLKDMDLSKSENLNEIPDLSTATNLETLNLHGCSSLVELPSSIRNLNKLTELNMQGCVNLDTFPTGIDLQSLSSLDLSGCSRLQSFPLISSNISKLNLSQTAIAKYPFKLPLESLVELHMEQIKSERFWEGVQPLTSLKKMVFSRCENLKEIPDLSMMTKLEKLDLNGCSSLVELTLSSIQNLNKLTTLEMIGCSSLETLPTGINLKSLYRLNLNGCSQLRSFPDISSNISTLFLNQTAIEEVPPCIGNFSSLESMEMWECKQLQSISPKVFKLSNLEVYFSDCEKLTEVRWPEEEKDTNDAGTTLSLVIFTNCFNLNQEAFIQQSASEYLILPGVEVPPYFTHRSTASSLTIPLHRSTLSQQSFLDFKACVVVSEETVSHLLFFIDIQVHCRFRDQHGNYFEPDNPRHFSLHQKYNHLIIFDCHFPLNQDCNQVEIEFRLSSIRLKLKGCGIRLSDDNTPSLASPIEVDEEDMADDGCHETEECAYSDIETKRSRKRIRINTE